VLPYFSLLLLAVMLGLLSAAVRPAGDSDAESSSWALSDVALIGLLVAFAGSRVGVGTDYHLYSWLWHQVPTSGLGTAVEASPQDAGFVILQYFLKGATTDPQALFWLTSALTIVPMIVAIKTGTPHFSAAVFLFISLGAYLVPFNLVRQGLAAAIVLLAAVRYLDQRRWVFFSLGALATSIHATAVIACVVIYLTRNFRARPRLLVMAAVGAAILAQIYLAVPALADLAELLNPRYAQYVVSEQAGTGTYLVITARIALVGYCFWHVRLLDDLERRYLVFATLGLGGQILGTQSVAFARIDLYFAVFLIFPLAKLLHHAPDKLHRAAIVAGCLAYMWLLISNYYGLLPYQSLWVEG
jgi:transmembrane protein EpsG